MNPLARAIIRCAAAPAAFTYDDIPDQLLRINSLEGSLGFSGSVLTSVTDVSTVGGTVNVTGSPVYTAADAGLNNKPSFEIVASSSVIAPNVNRASIRYIAAVLYRDTGATFRYIADGDDASGRILQIMHASGVIQVWTGATLTTPTGEPSVGRKIWLAPNDNSTQVRWSPASGSPMQDIGTQPVGSATGNGVTIGQAYSAAGYGARFAFLMMCSAVPDAPTRAALEAKLITDFG